MGYKLLAIITVGSLPFLGVAHAQTSTTVAACKDGTTWTGSSHRGACSRHGGVASYTAALAPAATAAVPPAAVQSPIITPSTTQPAASAAPTAVVGSNSSCPGDKVVWVNTQTHVYHLQGERYYGKTAAGKYMCERAADAEGDRTTRNGQ